ncbi:TetR/AcrR family transcriptional regulator [Nocardiopsis ansamitocini]|nr:TetR/AcrR family transcriptional regulator [Nocardiopsis ansamitocini]
MGTAIAEHRPTGLRERKKARTREALVEAGMRLFGERGYQATTTEEIAASADVSQRTFFRYFGSKEELVLAAQEGMDELLYQAVRARPLQECALTAARNALRDQWELSDTAVMHAQGEALRLIDTNTDLLAAQLRYCHERQEQLAALLAERAGVDPATDPRPGLVAAVFFATVQNGHTAWCRSGRTDLKELVATMLDHLDQVGEAITTNW